MGKYLKLNGKNLSFEQSQWNERSENKAGFLFVIKYYFIKFTLNLPMLTSTASVHLSSSTLDTEHRYDPACSEVAWEICKINKPGYLLGHSFYCQYQSKCNISHGCNVFASFPTCSVSLVLSSKGCPFWYHW